MRSDTTLFMRFDRVEAAWCILQPVFNLWSSSTPEDSPNYAAGSWGAGPSGLSQPPLTAADWS